VQEEGPREGGAKGKKGGRNEGEEGKKWGGGEGEGRVRRWRKEVKRGREREKEWSWGRSKIVDFLIKCVSRQGR
jgi:hypothetical protein